jgi:antitoxin VapB
LGTVLENENAGEFDDCQHGTTGRGSTSGGQAIYKMGSDIESTRAMALSLKDPETDSLARQVASLTGETLTEAVRVALRERLRQERIKRGERPWDEAAIQAIIDRCASLPELDTRTGDEILGYD